MAAINRKCRHGDSRELAAAPVGDTTLADQTISFIQQLSESVQQVPRAVVVATLPATRYGVARSEHDPALEVMQEAARQLGLIIEVEA